MNNMLNYVIKNSKENIKEELEIINELIVEGKVNLETPVEGGKENYSNLKEFIFYRYRKNPINNEIVDFMEKHNIGSNLSGEDAYEFLLNILTAARFKSTEQVKESWEEFKAKGVSGGEILKHIQEINKTNPYKVEGLFRYIFESKENNIVFLFNTVIDDFLGFNNIEILLEKYMNKNYFDLIRNEKDGIIALLNAKPEIGEIEDDKGKILIQKLFEKFPDDCVKGFNDEIEKKKWVDWYFKERIEIKNPYITRLSESGSNINLLLSRKEWYKTICGDEDVLSVLIKDEHRKEVILIELKKDADFKEYVLKREKNLLIEYLSMNPENALLKEYKVLSKRLPELQERSANKEGILDVLIDGSNKALHKNSKFYELVKSLPKSMLLTSSSDRLLEWSDSIPFYDMVPYSSASNRNERQIYDDLFSLSISLIDHSFLRTKEGGFEDKKVEEARVKLCIQRDVRNLIELSYNKFPDHNKIEKIIEGYSLSLKALKDFKLIPELIKQNRLGNDYLQNLIARKEKEILSDNLIAIESNNQEVVKKRI